MLLADIFKQKPREPQVIKRPIIDGHGLNPDLFIEHAEKLKKYLDYQNKASVLWAEYDNSVLVWLDSMFEQVVADVSHQFPVDKREIALQAAKKRVDSGDFVDYDLQDWIDLRDELEFLSNLFS